MVAGLAKGLLDMVPMVLVLLALAILVLLALLEHLVPILLHLNRRLLLR